LEDRNLLTPVCSDTNLNNPIYTKLANSPSRKISGLWMVIYSW